jgi:CRISPR/Cas system-associated endonuclease Cas1
MRGDLNYLGNAWDAYFNIPDEVFKKMGFSRES